MPTERNFPKIFFIAGLTGTFLAGLFKLICFSSSHWIDRHEGGDPNFISAGLWEVCYDGYKRPDSMSGQSYKGCYWVFSDEVRALRDIILPSWFISVQVMISLTFLLQGLVAVFLLCVLIHCCPIHVKPLILTLSSIVMFLCGLLITISLIVFGVKSEDRQWMPRPDQNYLSWSFGICVLSGFFSLFSAMCLLVASISSSRDQNVDSKAHRMRRY
ncbi:uncharacterized protein LOC115211099 isoform X1 [Octopus sinensis]|uniref:Uncharacterized protein LOC115211099 isoform X1 n=1 Tax=Octopus sinensis TaxID=2607531 RepID=A0A6P7SC11_9MOLL|nr:uncharacterized protein LOC115211099 isoform X1 [Octopus sinensis]